MPAASSFDYAVLRVVPCVERAEFVNAGVVLHCAEAAYLGCRIGLAPDRLLALAPDADLDVIRQHLESFERIAAGDPEAGPIARLTRSERFHWMTAPRNTVVQVSPVHSGLCESAEATLEELFQRLVLR